MTLFGHEISKKALWIGGGVLVVAVVVIWRLRSQAAAANAAAGAVAPDQSAGQGGAGGGAGGGYTVQAPTQASADQYSQQMAQDSLAAQGQALQYLFGLQQQQQAAAALQASTNPAAQYQAAQAANAAFFAANPLSEATPTGVVQEKWQQFLLNGQTIWEDVSGKNRAPLTESFAEQVGAQPKGEGPYYQSKGGGVLQPIIGALGNVLHNVVQGAANATQSAAGSYLSAQGVPYAGAVAPPPASAPFYPTPTGAPIPRSPVTGTPAAPVTIARAAPHGYHELGGV